MLSGRRLALRALLGGTAAWALLPTLANAETYTYDALGRLTSVTYDNGDVIYYVYDSAGNRTQVQRNGTPPAPPSPSPPPPPAALSVGISATTWVSGPTGEDAPIAALVSGGVPPYTWTWQRVSGIPAVVPETPTDSWTIWQYTGSSIIPPIKAAVYRCRVIDAASTTAYSPNVTASIDVS